MRVLVLILAACVVLAPGGATAEVVLAEDVPRSVAVSLGARADYLGQIIRMSVPDGESMPDLAVVRKRVLERFSGSRQVKVVEGRWTPQGESAATGGSFIQIAVLLPLKSEDESSLDAAQELSEAMTGLDLSYKKVQVSLSPLRLAVDNAEQHRLRILDAIKLEMDGSSGRLGQGIRTTLSGFDGPV